MRYEIFSHSEAPLKIDVMGCSGDTDVTRWGPGRRNVYLIHYVLKGMGYFNGNPVKSGQGFIIYPGQKEEYFPSKDNPWEFLWVLSTDHGMKPILQRYNANPESQIFDFTTLSTIRNIANEIKYKTNKPHPDSLEMLELYLRILNSHIHTGDEITQKTNSEKYLEFCTSYINSHIYEPITVKTLTHHLGISQPYLYRIFIQKFNMSPKQYITDRKLSKAKNMLLKTDIPITQVANSIGYTDVLAFSKMFASNEKTSPREFRKKHSE